MQIPASKGHANWSSDSCSGGPHASPFWVTGHATINYECFSTTKYDEKGEEFHCHQDRWLHNITEGYQFGNSEKC